MPSLQASSGWHTTPLSDLLAYRFAHRLPVPAPYASPLHAAVLGNRGIGRRSPTAVAKRLARKARKSGHAARHEDISTAVSATNGSKTKAVPDASQRNTPLADGAKKNSKAVVEAGTSLGPVGSKDELVAAIRKHFNAMPAEESVVLARILYRVSTRGEFIGLYYAMPRRCRTNSGSCAVSTNVRYQG